MSIYNKATLVQIPSGYKAADAKLYSVLPNTADGDFTVSADADATRVNKDGLIESTSANQARLNYNFIDGIVQPDPHLLLEPTRTNLLSYSEDFSQWGVVRGTISGVTSPTGSNTAALYTKTENSNEGYVRRSFTVSSVGTYSVSVFLKYNNTQYAHFLIWDESANGVRCYFDIENGTIGSASSFGSTFAATDLIMENYGNGWYRCSAKVTVTGSDTGWQFYVSPSGGDNSPNTNTGAKFNFFGAQVEQGSYPTSYIPTVGSAVTRTVDTCGTSDTNLINNAEGVLFVDFEFSEQGTASSYQFAIGLYNSGGGGSQRIFIDNYSGKLRIYIVSPSGTRALFDSSNSISNVVANQRYKVAIRYKNGDSASYVNGELYKADSGSVSGFDLVKMVFGYANFGNTLMHRGKIYQAMYFDTALSESELEEITSYKSFGQMAKALLYTIE